MNDTNDTIEPLNIAENGTQAFLEENYNQTDGKNFEFESKHLC